MSGHSKWSTIKRKKGAADQKRGKVFTRIIHEIAVAAREGGGDPNSNAKLRLAIDKGKSVNMPNDTIDRAIKRASGELKGQQAAQELYYEGYGPGGSAILVEVLTDNKNRTAGDIRHAFSRRGGALGEAGCVSWMFEKKGVLTIGKKEITEDALVELALSSGAEDVKDEDDVWEVSCSPGAFDALKKALESSLKIETAEIGMIPKTWITLSGDEAEQLMSLLEELEEMDDVLSATSNGDFVMEGDANS